jgi:hypothetical protein
MHFINRNVAAHMSKEHRIKTIERADGKARLFIFQRDDGLFRFEGESEREEDVEVFVAPCDFSGLYKTAEEAEQAAQVDVLWLRRQLRS